MTHPFRCPTDPSRLNGFAARKVFTSSNEKICTGPLSRREAQVLEGYARGFRVAQIAYDLGVSDRTVEHHTRSARDRLGAATRDQAIAIAVAYGWITV